jgi:hypothetical protein
VYLTARKGVRLETGLKVSEILFRMLHGLRRYLSVLPLAEDGAQGVEILCDRPSTRTDDRLLQRGTHRLR